MDEGEEDSSSSLSLLDSPAVSFSPRAPASCLVCGLALSGLSSVLAAAHLSSCLDSSSSSSSSSVLCPVCSAPLGPLAPAARTSHVERCLGAQQQQRLDGPAYRCLVCAKDLSGASAPARAQHVKSCAKKTSTTAADMRLLAQNKPEQRAAAPPPGAGAGAGGGTVYHDPVSGFTRTIAASAAASSLTPAQRDAKARRGKSKKSSKKKDRDDDFLVVGDDDEMAQIALALAASLGPNNQNGSGGGCESQAAEDRSKSGGDKGVPLQSLQLEPPSKSVDLAGFRVPTLSQVVNEVAPLAEPQPEQYKLPASKMSASSSKRSIWKKATERPNPEAGTYLAAERTPVLPSPSAASPAVVAVTAAPAPKIAAKSPDATPVKRVRRNVLEIDANVEAQVRTELTDIGNAYMHQCKEALDRARNLMEAARTEYFVAIGKCAIERDTAIEQLMKRYQLHPGHYDSLPMLP